MQTAYAPLVTLDTYRLATRRANLRLVFQLSRVGGPAALARMLGKPTLRGHLSNIAHGRRGLGDELAADIERVVELSPGWMDQQHPNPGEGSSSYATSQTAGLETSFDVLPLLSWEDVVKETVPEIFRAVLPDDALAPDYPAGTEVVWTTRRRAAPGRLILVRDRHGQLHARQCHQGRAPGLWLAAAINPAYVTFSSSEDGLELVAVYKGRLEPDD